MGLFQVRRPTLRACLYAGNWLHPQGSVSILRGSVPILRVLPHIEGLSPFSKVCPRFGVCLYSND